MRLPVPLTSPRSTPRPDSSLVATSPPLHDRLRLTAATTLSATDITARRCSGSVRPSPAATKYSLQMPRNNKLSYIRRMRNSSLTSGSPRPAILLVVSRTCCAFYRDFGERLNRLCWTMKRFCSKPVLQIMMESGFFI